MHLHKDTWLGIPKSSVMNKYRINCSQYNIITVQQPVQELLYNNCRHTTPAKMPLCEFSFSGALTVPFGVRLHLPQRMFWHPPLHDSVFVIAVGCAAVCSQQTKYENSFC